MRHAIKEKVQHGHQTLSNYWVYRTFQSPRTQKAIRFLRVAFISVSIYQIGYSNGMVHFAQNPKGVELEMIRFSLGIPDGDKLEDHVHPRTSRTHLRVKTIGERIIGSAVEHCKSQVEAATREKASMSIATKADKGEANRFKDFTVDQLDAEIEKWQKACNRLNGKWSFVVSKSPVINAFVTGFCPRKVFVCTGIIERLKLTDDELAMVIGHELSHVILGHTEEEIPTSAVLLGTQLVLMALVDPTGILSYVFDASLSYVRQFLTASYSRQHETEADELGLLLTSLACFDVKAGSSLHEKLSQMKAKQHTDLLDTHPASPERQVHLSKLARAHEVVRNTDPRFATYHQDCQRYQKALSGFRLGFGFK